MKPFPTHRRLSGIFLFIFIIARAPGHLIFIPSRLLCFYTSGKCTRDMEKSDDDLDPVILIESCKHFMYSPHARAHVHHIQKIVYKYLNKINLCYEQINTNGGVVVMVVVYD